jgi:hypothetical protein
MMKRLLTGSALVVAAIFGTATALPAQVGMGIGGGPSMAVGGLDDFGAGWHAQGSLSIGLPLLPFGLRGDLLYQQLPRSGDGDNYRQIAGVANATLDVLPIPLMPVRPYIIGGLGLFNHDGHPEGDGTDLGVNLGAGVRVSLLGFGGFLEAKYQNVFTDGASHGIVPITLGITF